jgi:carbon starvation protein
MVAVRLTLWAILAVLGAVILAFMTGLVNPHEKVNELWLVVAAACIYVLAYRFYGRWLGKQVVELNNQRVTPAVRLNNGVNYHPANYDVAHVGVQAGDWLSPKKKVGGIIRPTYV